MSIAATKLSHGAKVVLKSRSPKEIEEEEEEDKLKRLRLQEREEKLKQARHVVATRGSADGTSTASIAMSAATGNGGPASSFCPSGWASWIKGGYAGHRCKGRTLAACGLRLPGTRREVDGWPRVLQSGPGAAPDAGLGHPHRRLVGDKACRGGGAFAIALAIAAAGRQAEQTFCGAF